MNPTPGDSPKRASQPSSWSAENQVAGDRSPLGREIRHRIGTPDRRTGGQFIQICNPRLSLRFSIAGWLRFLAILLSHDILV